MTTRQLHNIRSVLESHTSKKSSKAHLKSLRDVYTEIMIRNRVETKFFNLNKQFNEPTENQ
jgi:hypothetical protein